MPSTGDALKSWRDKIVECRAENDQWKTKIGDFDEN